MNRTILSLTLLTASTVANGQNVATGSQFASAPPTVALQAHMACLEQETARSGQVAVARARCAATEARARDLLPAAGGARILEVSDDEILKRVAAGRSTAAAVVAPRPGSPAQAMALFGETPSNLAFRDYTRCVTKSPAFRANLERAQSGCVDQRNALAQLIGRENASRVLPETDKFLMSIWMRVSKAGAP